MAGECNVWLLLGYLTVCVAQYTFDDSHGLGRSFDGIGGLSGGGATSKLLPGYPKEQRDQILDYLFKPNFAASLQILKVEIGGGSQSGIGSEATHMYFDGDENYQRGYEWWIMKEAKKRNPEIRLYGLPWVFSGYVGNGTKSPYMFPELTVNYIIKWIQGAKEYHNLTIDYIGEWNEQNFDARYLKMLRKALDSNGLQHVRIVAADDFQAEYEMNLARDMLLDAELSNSVDYFGVHYSNTISNLGEYIWGKQLWASEDYSTFNDEHGARCWARILNQNYVNGLMTSTISWNLIAAYYEGMPYEKCGLMTANSPWSGHYDVDPTIWMTAHTTQFTRPGWTYLSHKSGVGHLVGGGSYVALTSPDKKDLTIILETIIYYFMSSPEPKAQKTKDSQCLHEELPAYDVALVQPVTFRLNGSFSGITKLHVWHSDFMNSTTLFKSEKMIEAMKGEFHLIVGRNQVYTFTTLSTGQHGVYPDPPDAKPFPRPYIDKFDAYEDHEEPYFVAPMAGSFEVIPSADPQNKRLRQMTILPPVDWCETENFTLSLLGNKSWVDVYVETYVYLDLQNGTNGTFVAARINSGGCYTAGGKGVFFYVFPNTQTYEIWGDAARTKLLGYGPSPSAQGTDWNKLALKIKDGFAEGYVNDVMIGGIMLAGVPNSGFVGFGTSGFGLADFDYILVS